MSFFTQTPAEQYSSEEQSVSSVQFPTQVVPPPTHPAAPHACCWIGPQKPSPRQVLGRVAMLEAQAAGLQFVAAPG
jgi:hypothetical protein